MDFSAPFTLISNYSDYLHAFVGYFEIYFPGSKEVMFTTAPDSRETHWKQTVFYLRNKAWVCCDDEIKGVVHVNKVKENPRDLDVKIEGAIHQKGHEITFEQSYRIR